MPDPTACSWASVRPNISNKTFIHLGLVGQRRDRDLYQSVKDHKPLTAILQPFFKLKSQIADLGLT